MLNLELQYSSPLNDRLGRQLDKVVVNAQNSLNCLYGSVRFVIACASITTACCVCASSLTAVVLQFFVLFSACFVGTCTVRVGLLLAFIFRVLVCMCAYLFFCLFGFFFFGV